MRVTFIARLGLLFGLRPMVGALDGWINALSRASLDVSGDACGRCFSDLCGKCIGASQEMIEALNWKASPPSPPQEPLSAVSTKRF